MKDRIEIETSVNRDGQEILKFYVHCDLGILWLFNKPRTKGVYEYFAKGRSVNELYGHKYGNNKALNKIVDRLPTHIRYVKQMAMEEQAELLIVASSAERSFCGRGDKIA